MEEPKEICPLCSRPIAQPASLHHLLPRSKGGKIEHTVLLHQICHSKIHATFTESELARTYNNIPKLLEHEDIQTFVRWVQKKPADFHNRNDTSRKKG
jgi:5-methylcytosine-specific restriction endonuclease McrA